MEINNIDSVKRIFRSRFKITQPELVSHITQRAAGKEPLFLEKSDYLYMLTLLKESAEKFDINFYAFCLMPNHVHLLLEPRENNLEQAMHFIFFRYAVRFNRKYERKGHLFGGPYRQAICLDDPYFLTASVYIHLNPVKAGLSENAKSYRWSSCALYGTNASADSFVNPMPVLRLLNEKEEEARRQYAIILKKGFVHGFDNVLEQEGAVAKFCIQLSKLLPGIFNRLQGGKNISNKDRLDIVSLDALLKECQSCTARSPQTRNAKRFLAEQLVARGFTKTQISEKLGISRKTLYNLLNSP